MSAPRTLITCAPEHIRYLACNLVLDDVRQFLALSGRDRYDPEDVVRYIHRHARKDFRFTIVDPATRLPAACGGYYFTRPHVMQSWMLSSPAGWRSCWRAITRGSRWIIDELMARGIERCETFVLAERDDTRRWYEKGLGMQLDRIRDDGVAIYFRGKPSCV